MDLHINPTGVCHEIFFDLHFFYSSGFNPFNSDSGKRAQSKESYSGLVNIVGTAILLIITLLVVPVISYFTGTSLGLLELAALLLRASGSIGASAVVFCC